MKTLEATKRRPVAHVAKATGTQSPALTIETVEINEHCTGSRWTTTDLGHLARIIAIIAMGQAVHAARIIAELLPSQPVLHHQALRNDAKRRLSIRGETEAQRETSRWHRDGLVFEAISWAAAQYVMKGKALLKDPHLSSTTQGLDGLMIELDQTGSAVSRATIFEDKCSENPRDTFRDKIMPAFQDHHADKRASELVATAAALLEKTGLDGTQSTIAEARILDKRCRAYRASLAVTMADDSRTKRQSMFNGYEELEGLGADQRIGAMFVTSDDLRAWFDDLAAKAFEYVDSLGSGAT